MLKVGLTGGIGSGKSLIASVFRILGIPVFNADEQAHTLTDREPEIKQELHSWLGDSFFKEGQLNRSKLAGIVFNDSAALQKLNGIIHPHVLSAFHKWTSDHANHPYGIHEAAILFESGLDKLMDYNILVTCPEDIRLQRIMARDGISHEAAALRFRNQWTDDRKIPLAQFIIKNDENELITPEILKIHNLLIKKSHGTIR
jgi:dephospho-CoA kinase